MAAFARVSRDAIYATMGNSDSASPVPCPSTMSNNKSQPTEEEVEASRPRILLSPAATATVWREGDFLGAEPRAEKPSPPQRSDRPKSSALDDLKELLPTSDTKRKPRPTTKNNRRRRKPKTMAGPTPTQRVYVPPHLRNKSTDLEKAQGDGAASKSTELTVPDTPEPTQLPPTPPHSSSTKPTVESVDVTAATPVARPDANPIVRSATKAVVKPAAKTVEKKSNPWDDAWNATLQAGNTSKREPRHKTAWPKNKDMKALATEEQSEGGVGFESNSDGDPEYDIKKLTDFNGDWLPAPVEWDDRKAYHDRHFMDHIMGWMNRCIRTEGPMECVPQLPQGKDTSKEIIKQVFDRSPFLAERNGDLVPQTWVPFKIEGLSPQQFWNVIQSRAPAPLSDIDLSETRPWWDSYSAGVGLLVPLDIPDAQLDHKDEANNLPVVKTGSSATAIENKLRAMEKARTKAFKRQNRPVRVEHPLKVSTPENSLKPRLNIYLRPVNPTDTPQMTAIYNHYVENSVVANEFTPREVTHIAARVQAVINAGLPWIVAVHRGGGQNSNQLFVSEKIVGFSNIDDYCDRGSMYRYCFEMEIYVHHEYLHMGIGNCLVDRMMFLCNPGYNTLGGYDWQARSEYLRNGPTRVIKTINLSYPHDEADSDEPTAAGRMLSFLKKYRFRRAGHLRCIGFKFGKTVDLSLFQHVTSEEVRADVAPFDPL